MADLDQNSEVEQEQKSWLIWAIELARRGIKAEGHITVHGPHPPPGNFMWGEAEGEYVAPKGTKIDLQMGVNSAESGDYISVEFRTPKCRSIWDVSGVTVWDTEERECKYPLYSAKEIPSDLKTWIQDKRRKLKALGGHWKSKNKDS